METKAKAKTELIKKLLVLLWPQYKSSAVGCGPTYVGALPTGHPNIVPSSNGQDTRFSTLQREFKSRWDDHYKTWL